MASIDSVSPSSGSANGGTVLTIGGRGLVGDITVMVGDNQATVIGAAAELPFSPFCTHCPTTTGSTSADLDKEYEIE